MSGTLSKMDIVLAVEATFRVELSDMDVVELTSVALLAAFIDNIERQLANVDSFKGSRSSGSHFCVRC